MSSCGQRRLKSDCADAQSDLSLRWTHMTENTFPQADGSSVAYRFYAFCLFCLLVHRENMPI